MASGRGFDHRDELFVLAHADRNNLFVAPGDCLERRLQAYAQVIAGPAEITTQYAPLQAVFGANLAAGGEVRIADPGRPLAVKFAARLEAAGWRVRSEELAGEPAMFLYRFTRPAPAKTAGSRVCRS